MAKNRYDPECDGCKRSQKLDNVPGGIAELPGDWVLNQYQGDEGYLGWMALQPRFHRREFTELETSELQALGEDIKKVELALRSYWEAQFPADKVKRVYVVYFYESIYNEPTPTGFHLHIHLIPRTERLGKLLRECQQSPSDPKIKHSSIFAWGIYRVTRHCDFPDEYRYNRRIESDRKKALELLNFIRDSLDAAG